MLPFVNHVMSQLLSLSYIGPSLQYEVKVSHQKQSPERLFPLCSQARQRPASHFGGKLFALCPCGPVADVLQGRKGTSYLKTKFLLFGLLMNVRLTGDKKRCSE